MKHPDDLLESEYTPNAASRARAADRACLARQRQQAEIRAAEQRQAAIEAAREQAEPIADDAALAEEVARLAAGWGLKKKRRPQTDL